MYTFFMALQVPSEAGDWGNISMPTNNYDPMVVNFKGVLSKHIFIQPLRLKTRTYKEKYKTHTLDILL